MIIGGWHMPWSVAASGATPPDRGARQRLGRRCSGGPRSFTDEVAPRIRQLTEAGADAFVRAMSEDCPQAEVASGVRSAERGGRALPGSRWTATLLAVEATETNKTVVRRLVDEVINRGRLDRGEELFSPALAGAAREWIAPFRTSFPDVHMEVVALVAEGDEVAGRFTCSGTHLGEWRGHPPTGRRFEDVDEVYFFRLSDGRITDAWGLEDDRARTIQLGLA